MENGKQRYIDQIRINTAYPTYRKFARILTIVGYVLAGLLVLLAFLGSVEGFRVGEYLNAIAVSVGSVIIAVIIVFVSRLLKEAALIFADIADSITDENAKSSYGQ